MEFAWSIGVGRVRLRSKVTVHLVEGANAAGALLADPYLGRIATGAAADLILVDGDPLTTLSHALHVVAVVRNGRFYSVSGLIDRVKSVESVQ